jgi:dienelactone hydrolase
MEIRGYLTKPTGEDPFPAVVLLHSCLGLPADRQSIGNTLAGWGYVALFVDDFTSRSIGETCAVDFPEGLSDAFGALAFVAKLPYVDKTRIAVVGYSQGADTALQIASLRVSSGMPDDLRFKAAAAFYPPCANEARTRLRLPTLILIGSADAVTPAADCQQLARNQPAADLKLIVYPGAGHVFDDPQFAGGKQILGMRLQFNQGAAAQSRSALRDFLAAKIGR